MEDINIISNAQHLQGIEVKVHNQTEENDMKINCMALTLTGEPCSKFTDPEKYGDFCHVHHKYLMKHGEIYTIAGPFKLNNNTIPNQEETEMDDNNSKDEVVDTYLFHFLMEKQMGDVVANPRIVTNIPLDSEFTRYFESMKTKRPVDGLLALSTGNWHMWMLQNLADTGHKFRLMVLTNKEMSKIDADILRGFHDKATFSWANDGHTFFLRIEGEDEWGLKALGISTAYKGKFTKRAAEVTRLSEMYFRSERMNLNIKYVSGEPFTHYDGINYISMKFALRMTNKIADERRRRKVRFEIRNGDMTRVNIRIMTPEGLIKGDAIIVEDLGFDVIAHSENLKGEVKTNGWVSATMFSHAPYHVAVWDTQSWINNRNLLRHSKHEADVNTMIQSLEDSFQKGVVPDWLMLTEEAHDDSGVPNMERLSDLLDKNYYRWQAHGLPITALQNAIYLATTGMVLRMEREKVEPEGKPFYYRKTWTPMTNAFLAAVVTWESLTEVGGITFPNQTGETSFFDPRFGWVMPGARFDATYDLHGGWDLDDSVKVILIKIFSTDEAKTQRLYDTNVLDPKIVVPTTEAEAIYAAMLVRSPNGPGEYSIEYLDQDMVEYMPWHMVNLDAVQAIDLRVAAESQATLLENVSLGEIPTSITYTGEEVTKDQSWAMITAQRHNPGIGRICNSLMNWSMSFGASFPEEMSARLEQMVDVTQQSHDAVSFEAITEEVDKLYEQMVVKALADDAKVDGLLAIAHPIPNKYAKAMASKMVPGRFTKFNRFFGGRVKYLRELVKNNSFQMRDATEIVQTIKKLNVSPATLAWAKSFYGRYQADFKIVSDMWRTPKDESLNPFAAMHYETQRVRANQEVVDRMVAELRGFGGEETHKRVLSLWHYILIGDRRQDRIILQPGTNDSVMDVLIEALIWRGLAQPLPVA